MDCDFRAGSHRRKARGDYEKSKTKAFNLAGVGTGMSPNLKTKIKREMLTSLRVDIIQLCLLIKNVREEFLTLKEDMVNNDNAIWEV